jgi:hypothetical protein
MQRKAVKDNSLNTCRIIRIQDAFSVGSPIRTPTIQWQYGWRFVVDIEGVQVNFEKDDDGEWRAVINYDDATAGKTVDKDIVEKLGKVIWEVTG